MCGIVGVATRRPAEEDPLVAMRDSMRHRGPDDAGLWRSSDGRVALAHRRLAIIDLSPAGHQPMGDAGGRLWVTFNGEIYNYRELRAELESRGHSFRTASDTEVILEAYRAWGTDCLNHLNGMFAFGLYDDDAGRLFLARDRAGEKPLFYWHTPGRVMFASELKALMESPDLPRRLDLGSLDFYLAYGYVPGDRCILQDVHKLPQGHAALYDVETDDLKIWPYWRLPKAEAGTQDEEELIGELDRLLLDSVRLRLVADVPVGILLSGGLDSSLVTAMAARVSSKPVKTFTITFPGQRAYDEGPYARLVAKHFGTDHVEMAVEPTIVDILPSLARQYDEPVADSSMVPTYLISQLIRDQATVALGGDGGDELFGGYRHYTWIQRFDRMRRWMPSPVRRFIADAAAQCLPIGFRGRNQLIGLQGNPMDGVPYATLFFDAGTRRRLLAPTGIRPVCQPERHMVGLCAAGDTLLQQATALDFHTYLVEDILVKVDRASMLTSLEVRAPWLDHRLIEMAFGHVPDTLRAAGGERKILPRLLAARLLPPQLDLARKGGFSLPLDEWFKGAWGQYSKGVLSEADPHLFDRTAIQTVIARQEQGYRNTQRLFALTLFELWRKEYRVTV